MPEPTHFVAIIGGAVAGSEAAEKLAQKGVQVVVFEQNALPYGKIETGLPKWHVKLRDSQEKKIDEKLNHPQVRFVPNIRLGSDITLKQLREEWGFEGKGLNYEMIMKPGPVTLGHFLSTGDSWRMLISKGESIEFPCLPCDEIHAMIKVGTPVEDYIKEVLKIGTAHHLVAVHGSVVDELSRTAEAMNIEKVVLD